MNNVMIFAVHPDDETLGCGGTLLKYKVQGDNTHWVIGTKIDQKKFPNEYEEREKEIQEVSKSYNFNTVTQLDFLTTQVDTYTTSELIQAVSNVISKIQPNIIYIPFYGDIHSDHKVFFEIIQSCTKSFRYPFIKKIYMMEVISETEFATPIAHYQFIPNVFNDITRFIEKKCEIAAIYSSEMGIHPFPRSLENIKALATYRGAMSNVQHAEAFMLLKEIG